MKYSMNVITDIGVLWLWNIACMLSLTRVHCGYEVQCACYHWHSCMAVMQYWINAITEMGAQWLGNTAHTLSLTGVLSKSALTGRCASSPLQKFFTSAEYIGGTKAFILYWKNGIQDLGPSRPWLKEFRAYILTFHLQKTKFWSFITCFYRSYTDFRLFVEQFPLYKMDFSKYIL